MSGSTDQARPSDGESASAPINLARESNFAIGAVDVRPATREVVFEGRTAVLEPRVMQFLIALHRAGGAVVSKDDLLLSCWNGRIVGEDAINRVVSRLRSVADKDAGQQFRIETITKVGYRLVAPASETARQPRQTPAAAPSSSEPAPSRQRTKITAAITLMALTLAAGVWLWPRAVAPAGHSMMVRLSGFKALAADLPFTLPETINAEITAAFNVDGVIGISAAGQSDGTSGYALGGTIYRVGNAIRVITRLINDRTGVVLWSDSVDYPADQAAKVPHKIAVDAGIVVRCGLSGAATYRKPLPDPVMSNYMQYCQEYWAYGGTKTLRFAKLVVAAVPDFSWGWSAVGNGYMQAAGEEPDPRRADAMRAAGRAAEDKAIALDPRNSEALSHKAYLIDPRDWVAQEQLFQRAIAAQPLDCGCEHYGYGIKLESVGRLGAAIEQYRAATDMLALWSDSQLNLARVLVATGREDQAKDTFAAAVQLSKDPELEADIAVSQGMEIGDYTRALAVLRGSKFDASPASRAALTLAYEALQSNAPEMKATAIKALLALPGGERGDRVPTLLAALGAEEDALRLARDRPWLFWRRSMRATLSQPSFPAVADRLGLMAYWRTTGTKPDVCSSAPAPPFCRMI